MLETVMLAVAVATVFVTLLCWFVQLELDEEVAAHACVSDVPDVCDGLSMKGLRFYLDVRSQTSQQLHKAGAARRRKVTMPSPIGVTYKQAEAILRDRLRRTTTQLALATQEKWDHQVSDPGFLDAFEQEVVLSCQCTSISNQLANLRDFGTTRTPITVWVPGEDTILRVEG